MKHLIITKDNAYNFQNLTEFNGDITVEYFDNMFTAPLLTYIKGTLNVKSPFVAQRLATIGGSLSVNADFKAPELITIGGALHIRVHLTAPLLTSIEGETPIRLLRYSLTNDISMLVTDNYFRIGCHRYTKKEWDSFTDHRAVGIPAEFLHFWKKYKEEILK